MNNKPLTRIIALGVLVILAVCVWLLVQTFWGYGHLTIHAPAGSTVTVNGHSVTQNNLRLRPGTYDVSIVSAKYFSSYGAVSVSDFKTTSYSPPLDVRSEDSIASAALGGVATFGSPYATDLQWFDHNTWAVMIVGPSSSDVIAVQYDKGSWVLRYSLNRKVNTGVPPDVMSVIKNIESGLFHAVS